MSGGTPQDARGARVPIADGLITLAKFVLALCVVTGFFFALAFLIPDDEAPSDNGYFYIPPVLLVGGILATFNLFVTMLTSYAMDGVAIVAGIRYRRWGGVLAFALLLAATLVSPVLIVLQGRSAPFDIGRLLASLLAFGAVLLLQPLFVLALARTLPRTNEILTP